RRWMMDQRIVPSNVEFWTRARRHLLKYGGEFVDFVPVRAEGAFLYDDAGRRVLDFTSGQMSAGRASPAAARRDWCAASVTNSRSAHRRRANSRPHRLLSRSTIAGSRSEAGPYPPPPGVLTAIQSPGAST